MLNHPDPTAASKGQDRGRGLYAPPRTTRHKPGFLPYSRCGVLWTFLVVMLWLWATPVLAENPHFDTVRRFGSGGVSSVAVGDVNGDAALDVIVSAYSGLVVYLNDGAGRFDSGEVNCMNPAANTRCFGPSTNQAASVVVGDLNNDGALDLVVSSRDGQNVVYLNDGAGRFDSGEVNCMNPAANTRCFGPSTNQAAAVAVSDLNNDGALDLVVSSRDGQNVVYLNDGAGRFDSGEVNCMNPAANTRCFGPSTNQAAAVAVGDLNNDGALDIIVGATFGAGTTGGQSAVYLNDGAGHFYDGAVDCNNPATTVRCFGTGQDLTTSMVVGDVDGDGTLDIIVGDSFSSSSSSRQSVVYLNDGAGNFHHGPINCTNPSALTRCFGITAYVASVAVGDLNSDGALDIIAGDDSEGEFGVVYLNDGAGHFFTGAMNCSQPPSSIRCFGIDRDTTQSVAISDVNSDGALDIIASGQIHLNDGAGQFATDLVDCTHPSTATRCFGPDTGNNTRSVAVGDLNGDGALDLVVNLFMRISENSVYVNLVYLNDGTGHFYYGPVDCDHPPSTVRCFGAVSDAAQSVAIGDVNGDGALDLIVAMTIANTSSKQNVIYLNDGAGYFYTGAVDCNHPAANVRCFGTNTDPVAMGTFDLSDTRSVAVGDLNGDGALDLIVVATTIANISSKQNVIYLNDGAGHFATEPVDCSHPAANVRCFGTNGNRVAVGDLNNDGALDLVVGDSVDDPTQLYFYNAVYLNDGAGHFDTGPVDCTNPLPRTRCFGTHGYRIFAIGDVNGDGALDLIVDDIETAVIYLNDGAGRFDRDAVNCTNPAANTRCFGPDTGFDVTRSIAVGDLNGDGALDLILGNGDDDYQQQSVVYLNDGAGHFDTGPVDCSRPIATIRCFGFGSDMRSVVVGDVNRDGALDLIVGNFDGQHNFVHLNGSRLTAGLAQNPPALIVTRPITTGNANDYSTPVLLESQIISIPFTLYARTPRDSGQNAIGYIAAQYSLNGGGHWRPAIATSDTITTNLTSGQTYVYKWDSLASGFFGQSDNVVIRLIAYFQAPIGATAQPGTYHYPNAVAGPFQWPYLSATTFPFRVRGTQVRVLDENQKGAANAFVYQLPAGQNNGGQLMRDDKILYHTSEQGYLPGRGVLNRGDQLFALWPVPGQQTNKATLYYTSGPPTNTGVTTAVVEQGGVQTLTISAANPLLLFDLSVSLEWDASKDIAFQKQLEEDLRRASQSLYDWTDGQVALGKVTVYQAKQHWAAADIQILASNQVRPNAVRGGIITQTLTLPFAKPNQPAQSIGPGQVHIGPTWNRYGDPGTLGEDWPRTLAHELGHYLLYLEDTYLGLNVQTRVLEAVTTCTGTAMSDPYQEPFSEFRTDDGAWDTACGKSLAEWPEWKIIQNRYPALQMPATFNPGPATLPFAFTQVDLQPAAADATRLIDDAYVQLEGDGVVNGRAYLIRPGTRMVDLGRPVGTSVLARGAQVGDTVCVFGQVAFGCGTYIINTSLRLHAQPAWSPEVMLTPQTATTVQLWVSSPDGSPITATLYPQGEFSSTIALASGVTATLTFTQPVQNMLIDLIGSDPATQHSVIGYALDNGPGRKWSHDTFTSGDGGVVIFPPTELDPDGILVLQTVTRLPDFPSDLTIIGRAYHVRSNKTATTFHDGSISFQYLGSDVLLTGYPEDSLVLHYWNGVTWRQLATTRNTTQNIASASLPGPGIYLLTVGAVKLNTKTISPSAADADQTHSLTVTGLPTVTYFMQPLTLTLVGETGTTYPLTMTSIASQTISVQTPRTLPADLYDLQIMHPGSQTVIRPTAFALYTNQLDTSCFFDDFQSGSGKWQRTGEWGIVARDSWEAMTDSPNHPYRSAEQGETMTTTLISQIFDLSSCQTPVLTLKHAYQLSDNDSIYVDFSPDAGSTWHSVFSHTDEGLAEAAAIADNEWNKVVMQALTVTLSTTEIPTSTTTARLRFRLVANDFGSTKGWLIDEVMIHSALFTPPNIPTPTPTSTPEIAPVPTATPPITPTPTASISMRVYLPLVTKQ